MGINNRKARRARNKGNPANKQVTSKMREKHYEDFIAANGPDSLGKTIGDLVDNYFEKSQFGADLQEFCERSALHVDFTSLIAIIGNNIDGNQAYESFSAWLEDRDIPQLHTKEETKELVDFVDATRVKLPRLSKFSRILLALIMSDYYASKLNHLNAYKILIDHYHYGDNDKDSLYIIETQINGMRGMEYSSLSQLCALSPVVRFALFDCLRRKDLPRTARPEWIKTAYGDLARMNQPFKSGAVFKKSNK